MHDSYAASNCLIISIHKGLALIIPYSPVYNSNSIHPAFYLFFTMADVITSQALRHMQLIGESMLPPPGDPLSFQTNTVVLVAGLPPVPSWLVARIEVGEFIDMGELLLDHVGITWPDDTEKAPTKCRTVSGILEWIMCFNVYMVVIYQKSNLGESLIYWPMGYWSLRPTWNIPRTLVWVAQTVSTPLDLSAWCYFLRNYPDRDLVHFFLQGLSEGFRVRFDYEHTILKSSRQNLSSAILHPSIVDEYLQMEVKLSRVAGPIASDLPNLPKIHYSRFDVIPKNHQPNKWRLIVDLSHPRTHSVNDGILKELCSIKYISIEDAINDIITLGKVLCWQK